MRRTRCEGLWRKAILLLATLAAAVALAVQGFSPLELLSAAWGGYHPEAPEDDYNLPF